MPIPTFPLAGDIITQVRKETRIGTNPVASGLQDAALYQHLQDLDSEGVSYPTSIGVLGYSFLDTIQVIQTIANTTLNGGISANATSLTLTSASGWDSPSSSASAGYIRSGNEVYNFFTYEDLASSTLSVVNSIKIDFASGVEVHKIYKLASDFGYPRALYRQSISYQYQSTDHGLRQLPVHPFYTIKFLKGTNFNGLFLVFPYKVGALDWTLLYQKGSINLDDSSDQANEKLSLPKEGGGRQFYIEGMKEYIYHIKGETKDEDIAREKKMKSINQLIDTYGVQDMSGQQSNLILSDW